MRWSTHKFCAIINRVYWVQYTEVWLQIGMESCVFCKIGYTHVWYGMTTEPVTKFCDFGEFVLFCPEQVTSVGRWIKFPRSKKVITWKEILRFNLIFLSISNLKFAGYTGSKSQVQNRWKIKFIQLDFSNSIFQKSSQLNFRKKFKLDFSKVKAG